MPPERFTKRINLNDAQREDLLNRLDRTAAAGRGEAANRRQHKRCQFRQNDIAFTAEHPGGGVACLLVCTRNLSAGGLAFVHGGYLHPGSRCKLALRRLDGQLQALSGRVASCRHIEGSLHEIGVEFDGRIQLDQFADPSALCQAADVGSAELSTTLPTLGGRILYVDDSIDDQELLRFMLGSPRAGGGGSEVTCVATGVEGLTLAERGTFDAVIVELAAPGMSGVEIARALRAKSFTCPIIGVTASEAETLKQEALAAGCSHVFVKPYDMGALVQALAAGIAQPSPDANASESIEPLLSAKWPDERMRPLILGFLGRLDAQLKQLTRLVEDNDAASVQKLCLALKGSAGSYGYPQLSAAAQDLHRISQEKDLAAVPAKLSELAQLARAACAVLTGEAVPNT